MRSHPCGIRSRLLALAALATLAACGESVLPVAVPAPAPPLYAAGGGGKPKRTNVRLANFSLPTTTIPLDGAAPYTVDVINRAAEQTNVLLQGELRQGSTVAGAGGSYVPCGFALGVLPRGTCTITRQITFPVPPHGLQAGGASFVLYLMQYDASTNVTATLDSVVTAVTLFDGPKITAVAFQSTTMFIGSPMPYSISFGNPTGGTMSEVWFQAYIVQGSVTAPAGGSNIVCPPANADAQLIPGSCSMSFSTTPPTGYGLTDGAATWRVFLYWKFANTVTLHRLDLSVTLAYPVT